ncbi:hypothetical protein OUZ56_018534 [Daphnia magna]|uniref:Uncharacterized protein n=1 Tax=Daphnia magna TaxID=35525 RepID=A0ABQ9Z987_9CRUS|nr:hypothetical protein OUZ56_018534 [Daphnia magna]
MAAADYIDTPNRYTIVTKPGQIRLAYRYASRDFMGQSLKQGLYGGRPSKLETQLNLQQEGSHGGLSTCHLAFRIF